VTDPARDAAVAPDLAETVVGFRAWRIVGDQLLSPFIPCTWDGPVMHARCWPAYKRILLGEGWVHDAHPSPHPDCQCGVYAYHRPGAQAYYGEWLWVEGVVSVWGRLEAHRDGLRAEHARIEALSRPPENEPERRRAVTVIAERLDVPLVPRASLPRAAASVGSPLPQRMLPGSG
jgi:hypothetical protein